MSSKEATTIHDANGTAAAALAGSPSGTARRRPTRETSSGSRPYNLRKATTMMFKPHKKVGPAPSAMKSIRSIITASWLNLLLVCIPISWALNFALKDQHTIVFVFSFLAIVPLAKLLAFATDELSMRVGQTLAGLLNATLGNAVELIVAIIALIKCQLQIVQSSLLGSILSNLLLVLGCCFFAGGTRFSEQGFGVSSTQLNSSLLTISVIALLLPAAFHLALVPSQGQDDPITNNQEGKDILSVSHGVSIILLFIYGCYLFFQLFSHQNIYDDDHSDVVKSIKYIPREERKAIKIRAKESKSTVNDGPTRTGTVDGTLNSSEGTHLGDSTTSDPELGTKEQVEEEEETPQMSLWFTIGLLCVVTVLVAVTAEWLVDSIDGLTESGHISKEFVGVILLPIVGNAAEHVTAVTVSVKDKLTLSLGVAVGSSIQIALFVIPLIVTIAWIMGKPLTLLFDPYQSIVLFLSVLTVNYVVQDGKSNWLEGIILISLYLILAVTFWFYAGSDPASFLTAKCT